jgi:lysophospholipase L1-like esterase
MRIAVLESFILIGSLIGFSGPAWSQLVEQYHPPKATCCLQDMAQQLADHLQDWNQLGHYDEDNRRLEAEPPQLGRVVFLGDSITESWNLKGDFPIDPYVNRGIAGQTTSQMLVRMFPDVINLHPAALILLAGTNDIAGNTGPQTLKMVEENIQAITELAQKHGINVILCSVMPVSDYTSNKQTTRRPPADILRLNAWLRTYVTQAHAEFADYYSAIVDAQGMLKDGVSDDGLHPNPKGYTLVATVAKAAIEKALGKDRSIESSGH